MTVPLVASLLLVMTACSGGGTTPGTPPASTPLSSAAAGNGTAFPTPPSDGAAFQAELLRDGVTEAEYERAILTTLQCMVERGGEYENLEWVMQGDKRVLSYWIVDRGNTGVSIRAHDDCYAEYTQRVDSAWQTQNAPSEEEFQEQVEAYLQCMRDAGYPDVTFGRDYIETLDDAGHTARVHCEQSSGLSAGR